jgi:hypothetical protein
MTAAATLAKNRYVPPALGTLSLVVFIALIELLIRVGLINRFIVSLAVSYRYRAIRDREKFPVL